MLKFFHVARISNFCIFLAELSPDFKHVIFSYLDELLTYNKWLANFRCLVSNPT